jgi:D-cysteine desulfhydrase
MGGSSWLGTVGCLAAGLELAHQIEADQTAPPDRVYVATGTMGTAAGIALGLASAGMATEVHAVRISDVSITNEPAMRRLLRKTVAMMRRLDNTVPADLAQRARIVLRDEFFGRGYAKGTEASRRAIVFARHALGLTLESTYTGKAMSALLADLENPDTEALRCLYWHTGNSVPLDVPDDMPVDRSALPQEFLRYFD